MSNCTVKVDHRFAVQHPTDDRWLRATAVNLAADYLNGFAPDVENFLADKPAFELLGKHLRGWSRERLHRYVDEGKRESLIFLVLMMTGECNADCTICFTDRRRKLGELEPDARESVIRQARDLGASYVYIPGEGEPTIDHGFWNLLSVCKEAGLEAIVFTNGLVLSDEQSCKRYWNTDIRTALKRLLDYPVSFYFKLWSSRPSLVAEMMNIKADRYHFVPYGDITVPRGLALLLDSFPRERVGIEIVVERRNAEEIVSKLIPFAEAHNLARIVELVQHNGRLFGDASFDVTEAQFKSAEPYLSPTSCSLATCKAVVTSRGFLSPRIAILEDQIPGTPVNVRGGDLFQLLHSTSYLVNKRYDLSCVCESLPVELAGAKERLKLGPSNINPPGLRTSSPIIVTESHS